MKVEVTHVKKAYVLSFAVTMAFTANAGLITFNAAINLPVGNGYIVGGQNFAANTDGLVCGSGGACDGLLAQTIDPRLAFVNATFSVGGGFTEPTFFSVAHEGFYGPSFSAAAVPEPSSMVLLAIDLIGVGLAMRYRKPRTT